MLSYRQHGEIQIQMKGQTKMIYTTRKELADKLTTNYQKRTQNEPPDSYLKNIIVNMTKADLLMAYADLQQRVNEDRIIQLNNDTLLPKTYDYTYVAGDIYYILHAINSERLAGGPTFIRLTNEGSKLDLIYGTYDPDRPYGR